MGIPQLNGQNAGRGRPNAGNLQQALAELVIGQLLRQFALDCLDLFVLVFVVIPKMLDQCDQTRRAFSQEGRQALDDGRPFGQADAELQQESVNLVDRGCPVTHEGFAHPMSGRDRLLDLISRTHHAHAPSACGFADGLRISKVILVALHERFHELRRDELCLMPHRRGLG